jgi:hypothetical protein
MPNPGTKYELVPAIVQDMFWTESRKTYAMNKKYKWDTSIRGLLLNLGLFWNPDTI